MYWNDDKKGQSVIDGLEDGGCDTYNNVTTSFAGMFFNAVAFFYTCYYFCLIAKPKPNLPSMVLKLVVTASSETTNAPRLA